MLTWTYHAADRTPLFQHYRRVRRPTADDSRTKTYGYRYSAVPGMRVGGSVGWIWRKHSDADAILYRLPVVLAQPDHTLVLTEGERDCLEFVERRQLASCHHGGAGKFTDEQAQSLAPHRGDFVLVADRDLAGAWDVTER